MTLKALSSFKGQENKGCLSLVPTPIGNLGDITYRALETLKEADLIAAEDTRNTQRLLNYFEIKTPQISFHEHNTQERIPQLIAKMQAGAKIAQVSDAGMPSISDPGHELVVACIEADIPVVALPGANAALTGLIASGICPQPFLFYGFLARKNKEQQAELTKLNRQTATMLFYEAPHRLKKTLKNMESVFGSERQITLCRELTKRYEEYIRGTVAEVLAWAETSEIRGEFVMIVQGNPHPEELAETSPALELSFVEQVNLLMEQENLKPNAAIKQVAKNNNVKRQVVYNEFHKIEQ
ncbi:16S rRNA (cytidine(1402)-2'-O)-methyltransferase [Ligilactobacillus ceti]|uniref:Ribosomal RNA small subunit methyltransferase I n=1 Tax=Ligilactobacillus ceti DSM 22408 TaxID=1122146 RepID=A0A0R2KGF1_9LACO|nr:16S rRNA (cytidine(1402)-2'-O)-methyltransferase [Ligilactobacillus ceti]KRN88483.1 tetrapyrrole (Corrin Porphyrin) methylase family protein [Ligilactobacillus ceti DSM 22408]